MKHRRYIAYLLFSLCLDLPLMHATDGDAIPAHISWDAVAGAGGYTVEVRSPKGEVILHEDLGAEIHELLFAVPPGLYTLRITTLNRFLLMENATEWIPFEVTPCSAPVFIKLSPAVVQTGKSFTLTVEAEEMSVRTEAYLLSPSGKRIDLGVRKMNGNAFQLSGGNLAEEGLYGLGLKNTEVHAILVEKILAVKHPEPLPRNISPDRILADTAGARITVTGMNFSPDVSLAYAAAGDTDLSPVSPFIIAKKSGTSITAEFPIMPPPGKYCLYIANSGSWIKKETLFFEIVSPPVIVPEIVPAPEPVPEPAPEPVPERVPEPVPEILPAAQEPAGENPAAKEVRIKRVTNRIAFGAGACADMSIDQWSAVYQNPRYSPYLFCDLYLTDNLFPSKGTAFDFSVGIRTDVQVMKTADASIYVDSTLTSISIAFYPSLTVSTPKSRIRWYAGGGFSYTSLEYSLTGEPGVLHASSIDPCLGSGVIFDYPFSEQLSAGICGQVSNVFTTEPNIIFSGSLHFSVWIPVLR